MNKPFTCRHAAAYAAQETTIQAPPKKSDGKKINLLAKSQKRLIDEHADMLAIHRQCVHIHLKRRIRFKNTGEIIASRLPPNFVARLLNG